MRNNNKQPEHFHAHCCPCQSPQTARGLNRREFLEGAGWVALGGMALSGLTWPALASSTPADLGPPARRALRVKPVLVYSTPQRQEQRSWRNWGGIQTQEDADAEVARISGELEKLRSDADFPLETMSVAAVKDAEGVAGISDIEDADAIIVYAAGGWMDAFDALAAHKKDMIFFCRHKSGPVYLWYEIISPRYLRQHTDHLAVKGVDDGDVVIDSQDELVWRLRALCGLKNTIGTTILAVGGAGGWAQPEGVVPGLVKERWDFDMRTFSYENLGRLIADARSDPAAVRRAHEEAAAYMAGSDVTLETEMAFVENAFLMDRIFRGMMQEADCGAITINSCMGTIMPMAETSACMTLSTLNDAGYLAFCESDFVVIPSGVLLHKISGKPVFLNDPTYPHDGIITLAHCTAPRRMDGKNLDPARIMTHFESDYGATPKVEFQMGQTTTNIVPDFEAKRWVGLKADICEVPFLPICRSQLDVAFTCDSQHLAERMPGFHWMTGYGDYTKEIGYALKRTGIEWECLA